MFTQEFLGNRKHLLTDISAEILCFLSIRINPESLGDMPAQMTFFVVPRILKLFGGRSQREHHYRLSSPVVRIGKSGIHPAFRQVAIRTFEGIPPASYTVQVGNDFLSPISVYRIIHLDVPIPIFRYVELLNNHITSDQITGTPLPMQVAKNSSNALQGSPSISSR